MKVATIPSSWILDEGLRLDPRPYTGGEFVPGKPS